MKTLKTLLLVFVVFTSLVFTFPNNILTASDTTQPVSIEETVYICTGKSAKKYHSNSDCRGLNNCKSKIVSVNKSDAVDGGKSACKICY